jgi:import inner membrane translocase subunit TIM23
MEPSTTKQPLLPPQGYATSFWEAISQPVTIQDAITDKRRAPNPTAAFSIFNPLASSDKIEYLFQDDYKKYARKSFGEQLMYSAGSLYLSGLAIGGAWGFAEGIRNASGNSFKLKLNSVLNSCTRRGPFLGNSLGILSIMYVGSERALATIRRQYDMLNSIGAAITAGMLFKSTAGLRAVGLSGLIAGSGMTIYQICKEVRENGLQMLNFNAMYKLRNDTN